MLGRIGCTDNQIFLILKRRYIYTLSSSILGAIDPIRVINILIHSLPLSIHTYSTSKSLYSTRLILWFFFLNVLVSQKLQCTNFQTHLILFTMPWKYSNLMPGFGLLPNKNDIWKITRAGATEWLSYIIKLHW